MIPCIGEISRTGVAKDIWSKSEILSEKDVVSFRFHCVLLPVQDPSRTKSNFCVLQNERRTINCWVLRIEKRPVRSPDATSSRQERLLKNVAGHSAIGNRCGYGAGQAAACCKRKAVSGHHSQSGFSRRGLDSRGNFCLWQLRHQQRTPSLRDHHDTIHKRHQGTSVATAFQYF